MRSGIQTRYLLNKYIYEIKNSFFECEQEKKKINYPISFQTLLQFIIFKLVEIHADSFGTRKRKKKHQKLIYILEWNETNENLLFLVPLNLFISSFLLLDFFF